MKYLIDNDSYSNAVEYTQKSLAYTHLHKGFEVGKDADSYKYKRVLSGQIAQCFLINFLRVNGLNVQTDNTTHEKNDNFDFSIKGYVFDVKCSLTSNVPMQVSLTSAKKNPHYFIFTRLSECLKVIEIVVFNTTTLCNKKEVGRFFV